MVKLTIPNPAFIFLVFGGIFFILWVIAPVDFVLISNFVGIIALPIYITIFLIGLVLGFGRTKKQAIYVCVERNKLKKQLFLLMLVGLSGTFLRLYERIYLRAEGQFSLNFMANRELMASGGSEVVAFVGSVLSALLVFIPLYVSILRASGEKSLCHFFLMMISLVYPLSDVFIQGSRSTVIMYAGVFFATLLVVDSKFLKKKWLLILFFLLFLCLWAAGKIFIIRTMQMGIDPVESMLHSGYAYFAPASEWALGYLRSNGTDGFAGIVFSFVHACQYMLHGIYEFLFVSSQVVHPVTNGSLSFYIPFKLVYSLFGLGSIEDVFYIDLIRSGVYTTLFGPFVYDYGFFGAGLASFFWGGGAGLIGRFVRKGKIVLLPLYLIVIGFLPFSFAVNLYVTGAGQYLIISSILLLIVRYGNSGLRYYGNQF